MPPPVERRTHHGDRVALIARQRPSGGLDQISLGLDLPPDLVLALNGELAVSVRVQLGDDGRPSLVAADIRCGGATWSAGARP